MFNLAIRNKFNTAAATILHFVFMSPVKTFYNKFHIVADNRYPKVIPMLKLIFYNARRWMDTALNFILQQIIFSSNFQYKTSNIKLKTNKFKTYVLEAN